MAQTYHHKGWSQGVVWDYNKGTKDWKQAKESNLELQRCVNKRVPNTSVKEFLVPSFAFIAFPAQLLGIPPELE